MTNQSKKVKELTTSMMEQGYRAYLLSDFEQLNEKRGIFNLHSLEVVVYENCPIFFVKNKSVKDDK